jgi:hypothetical protein
MGWRPLDALGGRVALIKVANGTEGHEPDTMPEYQATLTDCKDMGKELL